MMSAEKYHDKNKCEIKMIFSLDGREADLGKTCEKNQCLSLSPL